MGAAIGGGLAQLYPYFTGKPNIYTNIKDWWNSKKDNSEMNKIANRIKNDPDVQEFLKKKNKGGWKEMLKKKLTGSEINYLNKIYRSRFNNESVMKEGIWPKSKLSGQFQMQLSLQLKKHFKGVFYSVGYDLYHNDKKILTIDGDEDSINSVVAKLKKIVKESVNEGPFTNVLKMADKNFERHNTIKEKWLAIDNSKMANGIEKLDKKDQNTIENLFKEVTPTDMNTLIPVCKFILSTPAAFSNDILSACRNIVNQK